MVKIKEIIFIVLLIAISLVLIYSYKDIQKIKNSTVEKIESHEIEHLELFSQNISNAILQKNNITSKEDVINLFEDDKLREKYEDALSLVISKHIIYAYMLYLDDSGKFRFLLDASQKDKAEFGEKFDVESNIYHIVFETKKPQFIKQKSLKNLYITYIYPVVVDNKTIAIINLDLSTELQENILEQIEPLEKFFMLLSSVVAIFLIISLIQFTNYILARKKAFIDPLTKVFNRNYLNEALSSMELKNYALAMIDLDKFKIINDTYGHQAGDFILQEVSTIIKDSIRSSDIFIRYGGEEFMLLINNRGEDAVSICERIRLNVSKHRYIFNNHDIKVTLSMGLHSSPHLEKSLQEAIKVADITLYKAKKNGRNRIESYNEIFKEDSNKTFMLSCIKDALELDRVICYYQPIYDHKNKEIVKYEALVRVINKDNNIIFPNDFLPLIKGTNLYYKITKRVLDIVAQNIIRNNLPISMNISFSDIIDNDIFDMIVDGLKEYALYASKITFEILESDEISDIELFSSRVLELQKLGVKIAIDDFGSGYSNFRAVLDSEANYLKIDGSLIKNIDKNEKDYKVVDSIIHFAKQSNMKTIAEFVHSKAVYNKLVTLDVDYMQGYFIAKPLDHLASEDELFDNL